MTLPRLKPVPVILKVEPLTPAGFAAYGSVIVSPFKTDLNTFPQEIPQSEFTSHQPKAVAANQDTALKTSPISPLLNNYSPASPKDLKPASHGLMSIFSSFPRQNTYVSCDHVHSKAVRMLKLGILERHPFTTQTFCPLNLSQPSGKKGRVPTYMLIVVAPSLSASTAGISNPPDLENVKAFFAPLNEPNASNMAVTYGPGTWHAPMIVLGQRRVDFLVTQFANGIASDDCQEVLIGDGPDESVLTVDQLRNRRAHGLGGQNIELDLDFAAQNVQTVELTAKL